MGRILLVEDDAAQRELLAEQLRGWGHDVRTAVHALEALDVLGRWDPDVLLTDIELPVMDGLQLLERLPRVAPRTRAVVLTAHATPARTLRAHALGCVYTLEKGCGASELQAALDIALEQRVATG